MFKKHKDLIKTVAFLGERVDGLYALLGAAGLIAENEQWTTYPTRWGFGYHVEHYVDCLRWEFNLLLGELGYEVVMEPEKPIEPKMALRKKVKEPEKEPEPSQ